MKRSGYLKRTPLARGTSQLTRTPFARKARKARPDDDRRYLEFVRSLRCGVFGGCTSPYNAHAHHLTGAGMGRKASDRETMPLCAAHHRELHEFKGHFAGWTRERRLAWQLMKIKETQARYERERGAA